MVQRKFQIVYKDLWFHILCQLVCICYTVFYMQLTSIQDTDIYLHTWLSKVLFTEECTWTNQNVPILALTYPLFHIVQKLFVIVGSIPYELSATIILTFAGMATIYIVRFVGNEVVNPRSVLQKYVIDVIAISSIFFENVSGILTQGRYYRGQGAPNPVHNPTYSVVRPIAWICLWCFWKMITEIENDREGRRYQILYMLSLLLSCLAKPSFAFVALPAFALMTLNMMIRKQNIQCGMKVLYGTIPTLCLLLFQYYVTFTGMNGKMDTSEFKHMEVCFGSYANFSFSEVICVTIAVLAIPIIVLGVMSVMRWHNDVLLEHTTGLIILFGWLEMFFLTDGFHGNFSWGWDLAA